MIIAALAATMAACEAIKIIRETRRPKGEKIKANSASVRIDSHMEDELARDSVRQEANLTLVQDNLTTQQDTVVPDVVAVAPQEDTYQWSQPTFNQVIQRWYKFNSIAWSYTASADAQIAAIDVSRTLFQVPTLFDRIKRFRYWRGGVKVRLQVNSTPFHYGTLYAGIIPYYSNAEDVADRIDRTTWGLSGLKCCGYLSANTGKPLELECPFQCPNEYLLISQQEQERPFYLVVVVMNPLRVAGGATNPALQLSLFAQFTDLKLMGPSEITANSTSKKIVRADAEQANKTKQGTLGKVAGAVSDIAGGLSSVPVIGSIASAVAPVSKAIGGIFDYFGWDKPTSLAAPVYNIDRNYRGMQHGSGQDISEVLALKPEQKISTETKHFGVDDETTRSLLRLIQTPMMHSRFTIPNNTAENTVFQSLFVRPYAPQIDDALPTVQYQRDDYLSYYSRFFNACRGGYRYFIHFSTSSFTTARVRITFEPSTTAVASVTDGGDSFSRIVDVNGDTSVVLEVPYCYASARMPLAVQAVNSSTPANGQLLFSLVNPIQTNGSSSDIVYVTIFRCAADDFRFYQPKLYSQTLHNLSMLTQGRIYANSLTEKLAEIQEVVCLGDGPKVTFDRVTEDEEIVSHNDILHRYTLAGTSTNWLVTLYPKTGQAYYWMYPFRAYRGAVRLFSKPTITAEGIVINSSNTAQTVIAAGGYMNTGNDADVPFEIPYNNNVRFVPTRMSESNYRDGSVRLLGIDQDEVQDCLWAAGDDFTLGLRRCPRLINIPKP